ncbi:MAG: 2,3-bisphosphoglycerate-independent phosphoglycerate mutase [Candidatus Paceibacterota bacterium]
MEAKACVLVVLDGFGVSREDLSNPIFVAEPKNFQYLKENYAYGALQANGMAVGMPWGQGGDSRVGHLAIGAGRIVYQNSARISQAVKDGTFNSNPELLSVISSANTSSKALHLVGLLSEGVVHANIEHFQAMLALAKSQGLEKVYMHFFSDGKDSAPRSVVSLVERVRGIADSVGVGVVSTIIGRYYGMNSNGDWKKTERVFQLLTELRGQTGSFSQFVDELYAQGRNDDFLSPFVFENAAPIQNGDSVVFMNFQEEGIRQLAGAFSLTDFTGFSRSLPPNIHLVSLTNYSEMFQSIRVAFPEQEIDDCLAQVISEKGLAQMSVGESINYASTAYYFNGLSDEAFENQFIVSIPSNDIVSQAQKPEMKASAVASRVVQAIEEQSYKFILANFVNADIVAQAGDFNATVAAIKAVDEALGSIVRACEAQKVALIVTSSHSNAERVVNPITGEVETRLDANPVPFILASPGFKKGTPSVPVRQTQAIGMLADVAPTILELLGIEKPALMTGRSLLRFLR